MADFFLGRLPIVAGNANFPLIGAWTAEVLLSGTDAPPVGTQTTLVIIVTGNVLVLSYRRRLTTCKSNVALWRVPEN